MLSFIWIAFAILVGVFASVRRNRNGFGWFVLSILISPLLAGLLLLILHVKTPKPPKLETMESIRQRRV